MADQPKVPKKPVVPYSRARGNDGKGSTAPMGREDFNDRTMSLFRCCLTRERTRQVVEAVLGVVINGVLAATTIIRAKPEELAKYDKREVNGCLRIVVFPFSSVCQMESLTPFQAQALATSLVDGSRVDFETHEWLPGKEPFKPGGEKAAADGQDPVLRDQLRDTQQATEALTEAKKKVGAPRANVKRRAKVVKPQQKPVGVKSPEEKPSG
jgi:hypothetical protein